MKSINVIRSYKQTERKKKHLNIPLAAKKKKKCLRQSLIQLYDKSLGEISDTGCTSKLNKGNNIQQTEGWYPTYTKNSGN